MGRPPRGFGAALALLLAQLGLLAAHREHKVHNIVLYPDKQSWCKTTPIKQVVTWPSCNSQELDNNVCVGACFSYMVPHSEPSAPGDLIRPYCDSCQPLDSIWHTVTLDCKDKDDNPTTMQKKVQIITNCSCSSCMESSRIKPDLNSLLQSLELESARLASNHHQHNPGAQQQQVQQPQLPVDSSSSTSTSAPAAEHDSAPAAPEQQVPTDDSPATGPESLSLPLPAEPQSLLPPQQQQQQQQQQSTEAPAPEQPSHHEQTHETPDLLLNPNLSGSAKSNGTLSADQRFLQLLKQVGESGAEADKLDMLEKLESLENLVKIQKLGELATDYPGGKELLAKISELLHKYSNQEEQQPNLDPLDDDDGDSDPSPNEDFLQLQGISSTSAPVVLPELAPKDPNDEDVPSLQDSQLRVAASLLHRTGPHHSLVLDAGVKEKIDVESHYLHPALEGQEISYHDNVVVDKTKKKDF